MKIKRPVYLATLFCVFLSPTAQADGVTPGNLHEVTSHIWRSARPTLEVLNQLAASGIKTIIDLEDDTDAVAQETIWAQQLGFEFISKPIHTFEPMVPDTMNEILGYLNDSSRSGTILVHCMGGEDRTGLIVGLYRVLTQKWQAQDAYSEMIYFGFHSDYADLISYYSSETGWAPTQSN